MGFPDDRIEDLKTAIARLINAIEHGNHLNENLCVGVTLSSHDDSLEVKSLMTEGVFEVPAKPDMTARCMVKKMLADGMFLIQCW